MSKFRKVRHVVPAFPIREHPSALMREGDQLVVVANQYIPLNNQTPTDGDITILLCHANGFIKELYEPFVDELLSRFDTQGIRVRGVWIPDIHCQGESGILNEHKLGGEVSWFDHTRDLMTLISRFPQDFVRPMVGIGHSMGGAQMFRLSLMHPTLFTCLIGVDPVITTATPFPAKYNPVLPSARRRDVWPSISEAEKFVRSRPFYKSWDPRCLDQLVKHGFRKLPTAIYPDPSAVVVYGTAGDEPVTLSTTKHQEVFTFVRGRTAMREDPLYMFNHLDEVEPPVLYVQGETSTVNYGDSNKLKMKQTKPPVDMVIVKGAGHLVPMEKPQECADFIAPFVFGCVKRWGKQNAKLREEFPPTLTIPRVYNDIFAAMEKDIAEAKSKAKL